MPEKINQESFSETSKYFVTKGCFCFGMNSKFLLKNIEGLTNGMLYFLIGIVIFHCVVLFPNEIYELDISNWTQNDFVLLSVEYEVVVYFFFFFFFFSTKPEIPLASQFLSWSHTVTWDISTPLLCFCFFPNLLRL